MSINSTTTSNWTWPKSLVLESPSGTYVYPPLDSQMLSTDIINLQNLLYLTSIYCRKYKVELVPEKTKLLCFSNSYNFSAIHAKIIAPIELNNAKIKFSEEAVHVGVLRSSSGGNLPNLIDRISAHNKQLKAVLPAGLALHHLGNPAAGLRVHSVYCLPVLLSGLSALVLKKSEEDLITTHHKNTLRRLMKLHERTPDSVVYFLAGSLPASAFLHLRQLSSFMMICHLKSNILHTLALKMLTQSKPAEKSWFLRIRDICIQYHLPHPLLLLESPPPKPVFKKLCKMKVGEYWHAKLRCSSLELQSLKYFKPSFLSLSQPHPIWSSLNGNPYETVKARCQAVFLSGRYRSERLCRFWSNNKHGFCLLYPCIENNVYEDIEHIFISCSGLTETRRRLFRFSYEYAAANQVIQPIVEHFLTASVSDFMQFMLDCSVLPIVISATQTHGKIIHNQLYHITRTWSFALHRERLKKLGRWNTY